MVMFITTSVIVAKVLRKIFMDNVDNT